MISIVKGERSAGAAAACVRMKAYEDAFVTRTHIGTVHVRSHPWRRPNIVTAVVAAGFVDIRRSTNPDGALHPITRAFFFARITRNRWRAAAARFRHNVPHAIAEPNRVRDHHAAGTRRRSKVADDDCAAREIEARVKIIRPK